MMKGKVMRLWIILALITSSLYAATIPQKYPSYAYVFSEFDIDSSFAYEDAFERFVIRHEKQIKRFYTNSMERGELYLPLIQEQLVQAGLSDLFSYLSMVESGFDSDIASPKKAVGLWQFMPATAKDYNLTVGSYIDERCDPMSATVAAIQHLQRLHRKFGKWYLAILAYNCGEGCLQKAMREARSDDLSLLIDNDAKYLPKETREYLQKILLAAMIGEGVLVDFAPVDKDRGVVQVEVKGGTSLKEIAKMLEMSLTQLQGLNAHYKNGELADTKRIYTLTIPYVKMIRFYMLYRQEPVIAESSHFISHTVVLGESLDAIAKQYQTDAEAIKRVNNLHTDALHVDMMILIPTDKRRFEEILDQSPKSADNL